MKCYNCSEVVVDRTKFQVFDPVEPTTIQVFCSEKCKNTWLKAQKKKK